MITQEMIDRINQLAKKKKAEGLTDEEAAEQKVLYKAYIEAFKTNLKAQLDAIEIVEEAEVVEDAVEKVLEETLPN